MDFIPQWVMGYVFIPVAFLAIYSIGFIAIFRFLEHMCKDACDKQQ